MRTVCLAVILAASLHAQGARSTFTTTRGTQSAEFLGGVSYQHGGPTDPHYIGRLRGGISQWLSGYFDFSYSRPFDSGPGVIRRRESLMFFTPGLQFHVPLGRLEPYLIGGLGGARFRITDTGRRIDFEDFRFAQSAGGGVRFAVMRNFGLSAEARSHHINDFGWVSQFSVGAYFQFGGE